MKGRSHKVGQQIITVSKMRDTPNNWKRKIIQQKRFTKYIFLTSSGQVQGQMRFPHRTFYENARKCKALNFGNKELFKEMEKRCN